MSGKHILTIGTSPRRLSSVKIHAQTIGRTAPPAAIAVLVLATGAAQAISPAPSTTSRGAGAIAAQVSLRSDPIAVAAREVILQETGHLHAVGEPGTTIIERGTATGTLNGPTSVQLRIISANKVTATFTVRPRGGSITGKGSARFAQKGSYGYFGGTLAITGGTGSYAHASGTNIGISGAISRETFALTVHVHGKIHI
jgi:hypothetical protein